MKYGITLAVSALVLAAWVSWTGGNNGDCFERVGWGTVRPCQHSHSDLSFSSTSALGMQVDATPDFLVRGLGDGPDIWVAGDITLAQDDSTRRLDDSLSDGQGGSIQSGGGKQAADKPVEPLRKGANPANVEGNERGAAPSEGGIDDLILEAVEFYDIEWAAEALAQTRYCESTNIVEPCVVGSSGELGPYQFLDSTWASTPYSHLDPCDLESATYAAAWMVREGRQHEFTCWPR